MLLEGALTRWDPARQIGTIARSDGGPDVPVTLRAFQQADARPRVGQRVRFELSHTWDGQPRARQVRLLGGMAVLPLGQAAARAGWLLLLCFGLVLVLSSLNWGIPRGLLMVYLVASIVAAMLVALQQPGGGSNLEPVLLALGLAGGWPGAVIAQVLSGRSAFRVRSRSGLWAVAVLNMAGFVMLASRL